MLLKRAAAAFADWFWSNMAVGAFGVWLVAQVFRDATRPTALCFLVPTVVFSATLLLTALLARLCTCRRIALAAAVLWVFPTASLLLVENQWIRPRPKGEPAKALRLVHWNVGDAHGNWKAVLEQLQRHEADAYALSEVFDTPSLENLARALGSDYSVVHVRQVALLTRGPAKLVMTDERIRSRAYFIEWQTKAGPLVLLFVDLPSRPIYYHADWLEKVDERISKLTPDLILGDFNASRRSWGLARLPEGYGHAYYAAGAGWGYTWPDPFPLWDLDQCVFGPKIRPIRYDLFSNGVSDHRMQVFEFSLAEPAAK